MNCFPSRLVFLSLLFLIPLTLRSQVAWTETSGPYGGSINSISSNDSGFIAIASGGTHVFLSDNLGQDWVRTATKVPDNENSPIVKVNNRGDIFIVAYWYIYRSTDRGASWVSFEKDEWFDTIHYISADNTMYGIRGYQVSKSTNYGDSWTSIGLGRTYVTSLTLNSSGYIFVGHEQDGVYRSTDDGFNWEVANNGLGSLNVQFITIDTNDSLYCGTIDGRVYLSSDNGDSWRLYLQLEDAYPINAIITTPGNN